MRAAGLKTLLVIPDDLNPGEAYHRAIEVLDDSEARQYVGALAYHLYDAQDRDLVFMRNLSEEYHVPVWMTEFSVSGAWPNYSGAMQ